MTTANIHADLTRALKRKDRNAVAALRLLLARLQQEEKNGVKLDTSGVVICVRSQLKKHKEAADSFVRAGMAVRAEEEDLQAKHLLVYLPQQLDEEAVRLIIQAKIAEHNWQVKDFGAGMKVLIQDLGVQVDGATVARLLRAALAGSPT